MPNQDSFHAVDSADCPEQVRAAVIQLVLLQERFTALLVLRAIALALASWCNQGGTEAEGFGSGTKLFANSKPQRSLETIGFVEPSFGPVIFTIHRVLSASHIGPGTLPEPPLSCEVAYNFVSVRGSVSSRRGAWGRQPYYVLIPSESYSTFTEVVFYSVEPCLRGLEQAWSVDNILFPPTADADFGGGIRAVPVNPRTCLLGYHSGLTASTLEYQPANIEGPPDLRLYEESMYFVGPYTALPRYLYVIGVYNTLKSRGLWITNWELPTTTSALFLTVLRRWTILLRELVVPPGLTPKVVVELEVD
ncbi:hypothetical protein B0H13DRAFT_1901737 [Mycena leptocephala]|nr:hypothetical protein B0H13DRAFT_1901737 [Mycena leptocephala]